MNSMILQELRKITPEEQAILEGPSRVNQALYHSEGADGNVYEAQRLIAAGKQIDIRKHTRFVSFPPHTHDYVEVCICAPEARTIKSAARKSLCRPVSCYF